MSIKNGEKRDTRFKQGNPGGPGRPKGSVSIIGRIKQIFEQDPERLEDYIQEILNDSNMHKEITQQIDGKPVQPIANANGEPFVVNVMQYKPDGNNNSPSIQA